MERALLWLFNAIPRWLRERMAVASLTCTLYDQDWNWQGTILRCAPSVRFSKEEIINSRFLR